MTKQKLIGALFASQITVGFSNNPVKTWTIITETPSTLGYYTITFALTNTPCVDSGRTIQDTVLDEVVRGILNIDKTVSIIETNLVPCLIERYQASNFTSLLSTDKDVNGVSLSEYIEAKVKAGTLTVDPGFVFDKPIPQNPVVKWALPKLDRDFNEFWNSPFLTSPQKEYCRVVPDLDICMSNEKTQMYKIVTRLLFTAYPERKYFLTFLHGDPASGKTTFILNLCALYHMPVVKITGDATVTLTKIILTVGPEDVAEEVTYESCCDKLRKANYTEEMIAASSSVITNAILSAKKKDVQLTEQESIIYLCMKHNLPLIVFMDEANLNTSFFQATLSDVITSGYFNVGTKTLKFNPSKICWFCAYNPNTQNTKEFEEKFANRGFFLYSQAPCIEDLKNHSWRKIEAQENSSNYQQSIDDLYDKWKKQDESLAKECSDELMKICASGLTPSVKSMNWFFKRRIHPDKTKTYEVDEFTNYYDTDVIKDKTAVRKEANDKIIDFIENVNKVLQQRTKGINIKDPNKNSFFQITQRSQDIFKDLIFCYRSVKAAVFTFIYHRIPSGDTVRYDTGNGTNPGLLIARDVCQDLEFDIRELQDFLFAEKNDEEIAKRIKDLMIMDISINPFVDNSNADNSANSSDSETSAETDFDLDFDPIEDLDKIFDPNNEE